MIQEGKAAEDVMEVNESFSACVNMKLNNTNVNGTMDTGAGPSVIDFGTLEHIGLAGDMKKPEGGLVNASGDGMEVLGLVDIEVKIQNMQAVKHEFKVINTKSYRNILIGRDFMRRYGRVTFDFHKNRIKLGSVIINCVGNVETPEKVRLLSTTKVPARCEQVVAVRCKKRCALLDLNFEPKVVDGVFVSKARVVPNVDGVFMVSVLNVSDNEVTINGRKTLGYVHDKDEMIGCVPSDAINEISASQTGNTHLAGATFGKNLSDDEKARLMAVVEKHSDVFARNPKKPKQTSVIHPIVTDETMPVKSRYYRVPVAWEQEVNKQIQEMLENGIIRPSSSPWNSPIILVKKKDGTMRFVCDFRGLNDVTKKDTYPLPHIRDVIDKMHGSNYWTTLDAASAYWSMPLKEEDKEKTAFSAP